MMWSSVKRKLINIIFSKHKKDIPTCLYNQRKEYGKKGDQIVDVNYNRGRVRRSYENIFHLTSGSCACITFEFPITVFKKKEKKRKP